MSQYRYISYSRQGLSAYISGISPETGRPRFDIEVVFNDRGDRTVEVDLEMMGPGDVVSIDTTNIVRREPRPHAGDFEPNYFPFIEFANPSLPWLFTPESSDNPRPWVVLLVIPDDEGRVKIEARPSAPNRVLSLTEVDQIAAFELPDLEDSRWWAHVQMLGDDQASDSGTAIGRVLCPLRLEPETRYHAVLVPSFRGGVDAGLGREPDPTTTNDPAWTTGATDLQLPVFDHWNFRTGEAGDFESLVRRLAPRPIPPGTGGKDLAIEVRPFGVEPVGDEPESVTLRLRGALRDPNDGPAELSEVPENLRAALETNFDALAELEEGTDAPVVAPPRWARWQSEQDEIPADGQGPVWFRELNLDPRHRAAAGLGAAVIRNEQEALMRSAWNQVEQLERLNALFRQAQLSRQIGGILHGRIEALRNSPDYALQFTHATHGRQLVDPAVAADTTLGAHIAASASPIGLYSPTLRRLLRPSQARLRHTSPDLDVAFDTARSPEGLVPSTRPDEELQAPRYWEMSCEPVNTPGFPLPGGGSPTVGGGGTTGPSLELECEVEETPVETGATFFCTVVDELDAQFSRAEAEGRATSTDADAFRGHLEHICSDYDVPAQPDRPPLDPGALVDGLLDALDPEKTVPEDIDSRVNVPDEIKDPIDPLEPGLACLQFPQPMYIPLRDLSEDFVMPGVGDVPGDTVTLLETNPSYIEAYLAGLSHEMSRELLWREFPSSLQCTFFRQFWDARGRVPIPQTEQEIEEAKDIAPIATWSGGKLGTNMRGASGGEGNLVLLIRGELLRRYPGTILYAVPAQWTGPQGDERRRPIDFQASTLDVDDAIFPLFRGRLGDDVTFFGFDITTEMAIGAVDDEGNPVVGHTEAGYFFVLQEQPTENRFGLDRVADDQTPPPEPLQEWADLSWEHSLLENDRWVTSGAAADGPFGPAGPDWGIEACDMASIMQQRPYRVAIHADDMIWTEEE